jgi:chaperone modulatory protein CbpM
MEREELITAIQCCTTYNLEYTFITWLNEHDLLQLEHLDEQAYIPHSQLKNLEQYITLHNDLDINLEGIEAISHLLQRVEKMQAEINRLKNQLHIYEHLQPPNSAAI